MPGRLGTTRQLTMRLYFTCLESCVMVFLLKYARLDLQSTVSPLAKCPHFFLPKALNSLFAVCFFTLIFFWSVPGLNYTWMDTPSSVEFVVLTWPFYTSFHGHIHINHCHFFFLIIWVCVVTVGTCSVKDWVVIRQFNFYRHYNQLISFYGERLHASSPWHAVVARPGVQGATAPLLFRLPLCPIY